MDSHDENHPTLVRLREWESARTPLELHFSGPGLNITLPIGIAGVTTSEVRFDWSLVSPPTTSPLVSSEGTFLLVLVGATLLPNESSSGTALSPTAPVYIWRDAHMCVIRPI